MREADDHPGPSARPPWSVPIALNEVSEGGQHIELVADTRVRTAVAQLAGLVAVSGLCASFDLSRHGRDGLRVVGRVHATVAQTCVVTLEPLENEIDEPVDLVFVPQPVAPPGGRYPDEIELLPEDDQEELVDGVVDLGVIATEFLILGVNPYPRKPGAVFEDRAPAQDENARPFAALAALKRGEAEG